MQFLHYKHTLENPQASVVKDSTYSTKSVLLIPCPGGYISSIGSGEVSFHTYNPSKWSPGIYKQKIITKFKDLVQPYMYNLSTGINDMYILLLVFTRDNLNIYYLATSLINIILLFSKWRYNEVTDVTSINILLLICLAGNGLLITSHASRFNVRLFW
jgi:hypothetical protein